MTNNAHFYEFLHLLPTQLLPRKQDWFKVTNVTNRETSEEELGFQGLKSWLSKISQIHSVMSEPCGELKGSTLYNLGQCFEIS